MCLCLITYWSWKGNVTLAIGAGRIKRIIMWELKQIGVLKVTQHFSQCPCHIGVTTGWIMYVLHSVQKYNSKDSVAPNGTLAKIFLCETFLLGKNILSKPEHIHIDICKAIQIRSLHVQKFREVVQGWRRHWESPTRFGVILSIASQNEASWMLMSRTTTAPTWLSIGAAERRRSRSQNGTGGKDQWRGRFTHKLALGLDTYDQHSQSDNSYKTLTIAYLYNWECSMSVMRYTGYTPFANMQ